MFERWSVRTADMLDRNIQTYLIVGTNKGKGFEMICSSPSLPILKETLALQISGNEDINISGITKL